MQDNLKKLCEKLNIATSFSAAGIEQKQVDLDYLRFLCAALGFEASNDEQIEKSLRKIDRADYLGVLKPVYVVRQNNVAFDVFIPKGTNFKFDVCKKGSRNKEKISFISEIQDEKEFDGIVYQKQLLKISSDLDIGYYAIKLQSKNKSYESTLIVAPQKCYVKEGNKKYWGFALQLYALKSKNNWGVGDFSDLKKIAKIAKNAGADVIGLNPLHVLSHDFPENASPYASISRFFLNPIYIDVEQTQGFNPKIKEKYKKRIEQVQKTALIDYSGVYNLKIDVLREIFFDTKKTIKGFEKYKKEQGQRLRLLALYQAIYHANCNHVWGGWRAWKDGLKNKDPMEIAIFEQTHAKEIEFFKFLQFEAARQFADAHQYITSLGLQIGLYKDLPVGVNKDSAELWTDEKAYISGAGAGAPPDAFFPQGQKWCLGAFNPIELKKRAYQPFLDILRANMQYAGALRMDHVMSLMRLFMIKDDANKGCYIYYNFEDMLALVALESTLNKCQIVGESIGNVPDGFVKTLEENDIYSMSVLFAERFDCGNGDFKGPSFYPPHAFVSIATHDMPPLKMWWFGYEIELKYKLKMIDDAERIRLYKIRENERIKLLKVLDENAAWPSDNLRKGNYLYGEDYPQGLTEAVYRLLARSASQVIVLQLEDILGVTELQNLPGTDRDKYPNWRHKLPVNIEDLETNNDFIRITNILKSERFLE